MKSMILAAAASMALVAPAWAEDGDLASEAPDAPTGVSQSPAAGVRAIVRGAYFEARAGLGYMVANADIEPDEFHPGVGGTERMGGGSLVQMAIGYDVTDTFALQALGGGLMISGRRRNQVRDLSVLYGGAGVRLAFDVSARTNVTVTPAAVYYNADNGVEKADAGVGVMLDLGLEYYVHVRHFSIGLDFTVYAPMSPFRAFVAISPAVKYTF